ncbi:glycoprotein 3-alpha-L-fucosyltransferase A-like [Lytechinus variegatus]|uniref:glycoprotein 3-alpha-L-fucosyltransferase A-like n=1 Tax=Lytechinus variegatus TaxID=7654 RepID=UPI001BB10DC3|nr:glycoprotein 3-alpha-L-fucosyltransferase A-like [Lytechinus variegatus]
MLTKNGKPMISLCLAILSCFLMTGVFRLDLARFSSATDNFRDPLIRHYMSETNAGEDGINENSPEAHRDRSPLFQNRTGHSKERVPCYRQIQLWRGKSSPSTPVKSECPGLKCGISFVEDTSYETLEKSDAVVLFHRSNWDWTEMQRRRPPNQAWGFYSLESPLHTGGNAIPPVELDRIYKFTMSYRPSSTIHSPYGLYDKSIPQISSGESRNWAKEKSSLVAWAASNCGVASWRRHDFVKTLANHVRVDMYGPCGTLACGRYSDDCWNKIKAHKFYLAVENSECRDYITEKFWYNALMHDIVPIVYGPPREDYERVAPPNSFIHLHDFSSFHELADYINLLDSNDTLYNSYFEWKKHGSVRRVGEGVALKPPFLCKVVSKVLDHEQKLHDGLQQEEVHPSMHDYWSTSCHKPTGFPHDF